MRQGYYPVENNEITKVAHQVASIINKEATPGIVSQALKRYKKMFSSFVVTVSQTFSATSQQASPTQNIDGSFGFICKQITATKSSTDTDIFVTSLQLSSATSLVMNNLPLDVLIRLTGLFQPFEMFWPPNSQIQVGLQNGAATAVTTVRVIFWGFRVPTGFINEVEANMQK